MPGARRGSCVIAIINMGSQMSFDFIEKIVYIAFSFFIWVFTLSLFLDPSPNSGSARTKHLVPRHKK